MPVRRMRTRALGAALAASAVLALAGCRPSYVEPQHQAARSPSVSREIAYVQRYWQHPNTARFGNFGGTDCVNFTSQALHARGLAMTADWGRSRSTDGVAYTKAWVSSTALMHYLGAHPKLATALTDAERDQVAVGDIAQLDWDRSGDRDHTVVVTRVARQPDGSTEVYVAGHSPAYFDLPIDHLLHVVHPGAAVYYWHLHA